MQQRYEWVGRSHFFAWVLVSGLWAIGLPASAQVVPDATLGAEASTVTPIGTIDLIRGGAQRGQNLFHSFSQFDVVAGGSAYFDNPVGVENIFSRVTGSGASQILGTLGVVQTSPTVQTGNANLYLINPNGIVFGPAARLDVGGSFAATTANALQFGTQGIFSATNPNVPSQLLTVNPSAFLFNQIPVGNIVNRSVVPNVPGGAIPIGLRVPNGKNLLLLGGDVAVEGGRLIALGGRVDVGAVGGVGTVAINSNSSLTFPEGITRGDVSFTNGAVIGVAFNTGGEIGVTGGNITVSGSEVAAGIFPNTEAVRNQAGNLRLDATGVVSLTDGSFIVNDVNPDSTGDSGNLEIDAGTLLVTKGSQLSANTFGRGNAGSVIINVRDRTSLDNRSAAFSNVAQGAEGRGGNIQVTTGSLFLTNGAQLIASTSGRGNAGSVIINARNRVSFNGTAAFSDVGENAVGRGGNIQVTTGSLFLTNGAQLTASTLGQGNAGNVIINARDRISFDGTNTTVFSNVEENAAGSGGNIQVTTGSLFLTNGAQLVSSTSGRGNAGNVIINARDRISFDGASAALSRVDQGAVGRGGNIRIIAGSLFLSNGAQLNASTFGQGNSGNVSITSRDRISSDGSGQIPSSVFSTVGQGAIGQGGDIRIATGSLLLSNGALLGANTFGRGDSGNVIIIARDRIFLDGSSRDGLVVSSASSGVGQGAVGRGGDIRITTGSLFLSNGATLLANTVGRGNAGSVIINARDRISFDGSSRDGRFASSATSRVEQGAVGRGGDIRIDTGSLFLSNGAILLANTVGRGNAGSIIINARDRISFDGRRRENQIGSGINTAVAQGAIGQGGNIRIATESLFLSNGAQMITATGGRGDAGNVVINARDRISFDGTSRDGQLSSSIFSNVQQGAVGRGGDIRIATGSLFLSNGAQLIAATRGRGNSGNVIINARDRISLEGVGRSGFSSAIFASAVVSGDFQAGNIVIDTRSLRIANSAVINARTESNRPGGRVILNVGQLSLINGGQVIVTTLSQGAAGNITVNANQISLSGRDVSFTTRLRRFGRNVISNEGSGESGLFADTRTDSSGTGGNLTVNADRLSLSDGAVISAQSRGTGRAGNLQLNITDRLQLTDSNIVTSATRSFGGDIFINTNNNSGITLLNNGNITTQSRGDGGNITVGGAGTVAFGNSSVIARSLDQRGGNITLSPFFDDRTSNVTVNADGQRAAGNIIQPDTSFVQNALDQTEPETIDTNTLLASSCIARSNRTGDRYVNTGTGGLPEAPGSAASSAFATGEVRSLTETAETTAAERPWQIGDPIVEPQGVYQLPDGSLVLSRACD